MQTRVPDTLRRHFGDRLKIDEPLETYVSFRIGGPADYFVSVRRREDLLTGIALAESAGLPWLVVGRGSNVLIDDAGFRGLVLRMDAQDLHIDAENGQVTAEAGVRLPTLGAQTARLGLSGFEFAVGIPGSVGGAVVMNAGAHGGCVADVLLHADVLRHGEVERWPAAELDYGYRSSRLQSERGVIVLGAAFQLRQDTPADALARVQSYRRHRQDTQPTDPGAGSIFRNPANSSSGALIDRAGLKGTTWGGAQISPKHGNFIVNVGGASSADVLALIDLARVTVFDRFGIALHTEVEIIGPTGRLARAE
ncbi:MAG TPA: UDP-N-acetylmuramate dehydrogenase [Chloroflexota bacterium]|nr:UDP-N-acetylmuramate dehydrogenase [Chloroflexota bacterium]